MALQIYADQMKSIDPSVKVTDELVRFKYNNHAVTVSKPSVDTLSVTLKAPSHMKYRLNGDVAKGGTFSSTDLKKALTSGKHPTYLNMDDLVILTDQSMYFQ